MPELLNSATRIPGHAPYQGIDSTWQIAEQITGLHDPIGPYIGSKTSAQIAISILAEMSAVSNGIRVRCDVTGARSRSVATL